MENKNEFDDIILEKTNKNEKMKKILMRVIALVILFLVVMIVMKLINGDDETIANNGVLPTEPISQNTQNNNFESIPITQNEAEDQFELLRRQIQSASAADTNETNLNENLALITPQTEPLNQPQQELIKETPKQEVVKQAAPKAEPKKEVKKEPKAEPKKEVKKADTKELFKNVDTTKMHASGLPVGLYVQVFSVNNVDLNSRELANIKEKGYEYKLYKTQANTKVLIGPFEKDKIANELAKIRKDISKGAFQFNLK